jgi:hypothetical protein
VGATFRRFHSAPEVYIPNPPDGRGVVAVDPEQEPDDARLLELIAQLHEAANAAGARGFPGVSALLDDCGFSSAAALERGSRDLRTLIERALRCLQIWQTLDGL